jgi:hypothetical protein
LREGWYGWRLEVKIESVEEVDGGQTMQGLVGHIKDIEEF